MTTCRAISIIAIIAALIGGIAPLVLVPQKAHAAAAFVQSAVSEDGNGTTDSALTTTSGNLFVAFALGFDDDGDCTGQTLTVSDSKSNSWSTAVATTRLPTTGSCFSVQYAYNGTGGSGHTFTVSGSAYEFFLILVHEVSGIETSSDPLDQTASDPNEAGTAIDVGPVTTTADGEYIFASSYLFDSFSLSADAPFTQRTSVFQFDAPAVTSDLVQTSAGSVTANFTAGSTGSALAALATFKAAASAPGAPTNLTTTSVTGGVNLSWTAAGGSPTTYGIWRANAPFTDTANATLIASISAAGTTYSDTSVVRGTNYYYGVTASGASATSSLSNIKSSGSNSGRIIRLGGLLRAS